MDHTSIGRTLKDLEDHKDVMRPILRFYIEAPRDLALYFPDEAERSRYLSALRRIKKPVSVRRLAYLAGLQYKTATVRAALRADHRFELIPHPGPERFALRLEYRHLTRIGNVLRAENRANAAPDFGQGRTGPNRF